MIGLQLVKTRTIMDLSHFDLNLLRSLDVLLAERNVTRAAARLYVTQQAASAALQRLRRHFGDELLTRVGRNLEQTPLAVSLIQPVREALLAAQAALDTRPTFDPSTSEAVCRIVMSDYGVLVVLPRFLRRLSAEAPLVRCEVGLLARDSFERVEQGDLDFCMTANDWRLYGGQHLGARIRTETMFHDDFVCVVDDKVVDVGVSMTLEAYQEHRHNSVVFGQNIATIVDKAWSASGLDFKVAVTAPTFSSLILMLPGTPLVATAQRRLAAALAPALGLRVVECPLAIPALAENLIWHERNDLNPTHVFLRQLLRRVVMDLDAV